MFEIIILIIIIVVISQSTRKKNRTRQTPPFTAQPQRPGTSSPPRPVQSSKSYSKKARKKVPKTSELSRKSQTSAPGRPQAEESLENRTFIEPTRPYRPARNAGERYEEWMTVPEGKTVCRCGYCGADNLIPKHSDPKNYTCYFCREEL